MLASPTWFFKQIITLLVMYSWNEQGFIYCTYFILYLFITVPIYYLYEMLPWIMVILSSQLVGTLRDRT